MKNYRVSPFIFLILIVTAILAFWKSYFGIFNTLPETATFRIHAHASIMLLWLLMLLIQALLIRIKQYKIHKFIGRISFVIVPLLIWTGLVLIHEVFNRNPNNVPTEVARLNVYSFGQLVAFLITWCLGILYRKRTEIHMRFMISTAFAAGTAIMFRVFFFWIPRFNTIESALIGSWISITLLLLILIISDWKKGIKKSVYWVVTILIALMNISFWRFTNNQFYLSFCEWYRKLPSWIFFD